MTNPQLSIFDTPKVQVHTKERTPEGTQHVQDNAVKFGGNCLKLIEYWQKNNIPLSDDKARQWLGVRNLAQRVADIRNSGVVVLSDWDKSHTFKLYRLGCQCATPGTDTNGCTLHK